MTSAMIWILVAVVVYLLGMLAIGFKYANNSTSEDFYLGGRKLGPIVTAMSTEASDMSAYLLMGVDHDGEVAHYTNYFGGQADTLLLVVVDKAQQSYAILQLNRDTMCMVDFVDTEGKPLNQQQQMQLALSHSMGTGMEDSCENTVRAVSALLYGVTIDGYAAFNMDSMSLINDAVGGVTVTIEDDFSQCDPSLVMGETITLDGEQAYHYLRGRMSVGDGENTSRMRRQRTYMTAFMKKAQELVAEDSGMANTLYKTLTPYMVTDLSGKDVSTLLETSRSYTFQGVMSPEGTVNSEGKLVEFYVDEASLRSLVLSLYYEAQ